MTNIKQPKIRFKGHIDNWEQRKLGEVVNFLNGKAFKQQELLDDGKYRVVRVGNFNTNDKWYYSDLELDLNKYIDEGDLLYLWATTFGPEIWTEEKAIYHYHIWKVELLTNKLDKQYLYSWLLTDKEKIKQTTNGTTMVHVTKSNMEQREFQAPISLDEQSKIGEFFKTLEDTIALYQQKLEATKQFKQTMLKKMFPRNGKTTPEIRFKGFTEDWEECKLGDKVIIEKGNLPSKTSEIDGKYPFFNTGSKKLYSNKYNFDYQHQVIVSGHGSVGNVSNAYGKVGVSDGCYVLTSDNLDMYFLFVISEKYLSSHLNKMKTGTIISHTSKSDVYNCKILCPKLNSEMYLISEYFRNLDIQIKSLEQKLELYKEFKKAMLQKMFI